MALDLGGGRRLVLAVGEEGWFWLVAGAAAAGLLLALSRYERGLVPRSVGRVLLALRLAAAAALVVAMLEPVARRSWAEQVVGRVVVGVDLSGSMETVDDRRPGEEQERLRTAEGLAPEGDGHGGEPARRAGISARILRGPALAELAREHELEAIGFARAASSGSVSDLAGALDRGEAPGDGLATDWGPVLDRAIGSEGAAPVLGVVLLTDGRRNAPGGGEDSRAGELARRGVPVFPVLVGSTVPPRDAAVSAIRAPASAFAGDTAAVLVEVKADGYDPGAEIPVTLEVPGSDTLREVVRAGPDGVRAVAAFRVPMDRAGAVELVAGVEPPGGSDGRPENDRRSAIVRVGDEPARVLLVDGEARWEFRYLRNALERDRRVDLDAVLLAPPPPSEGSEPTYASTLPGDSGEGSRSDGPDPINAYDVIILGDVPPGLAPPDLWDRLDAFVSERGGTLVIAAGPRGWPGGWSGVESARAMLPVLDPRAVAVDRSAVDPSRAAIPPGVAVVPGDSAGESPGDWPMLQFAADPGRSRAAWEGLAPLGWALAGRAKPGASALVVVDEGSGEDGGASGVVVAAQPFGLGKVLWVGTDGTWRWRLRVGDAYHHRFWGQVVRWAAEGPTAGGNRLVRFGPDRPELPEGVPVSLRAEFSEEAPGVSPELIAAARIFEEGGDGTPDRDGREPVALVPLRASPDRPRTFEASAPHLPSGRYVAVLDVPELAGVLEEAGLSAPEASFEVSPEETDELVELAADRDALDRLASITGGRVVRDFEAGLLPALIAPRAVEETRTAEVPLWDTPAGLLAFFGLMAAEWIVRKRAGLP
ncbi:vWA domain-containing protein [Tautonia plasticadhaerens]|uniref:VWFA domain-containing protein n=1 Tax=Tautonia plasticadhaerens TaxID=2527974 RepID=A0A518HDC0_9BACT|nr:VWA domain-containing protein [Tautonia plasticadhaerens]QDV38852.1 hypothetical protein ElP_68100 [Tautonia plasticadhaerens]